MITKFIEATNGPLNWGKFLVGRFEPEEWAQRSGVDLVDSRPLLGARGWAPHHLLVLDLQTGEGAIFRPGGHAGADLQKHRIWVCPLFEPFLAWLYKQELADLDALPAHVDLPAAPFEWRGHRRAGPEEGAHGADAELALVLSWVAEWADHAKRSDSKEVAALIIDALLSGEHRR